MKGQVGSHRAADILIGCDSGTRAVKVLAMTSDGVPVASAIEAHPAIQTAPDGAVEQDARLLLRALERAISRVTRIVGAPRVAAIALTTQRDCVVALRGRTPARPMFSWMDRRVLDATSVPRSYRAPALAQIFRHSRARWVERHEPDVFGAVTHWSTLGAYFHLHLCDRLVESSAALPVTFPIERWTPGWSSADAEWRAAGMSLAAVPTAVAGGTELGTISANASRRTGLARGTPVIATGGDKNCEVLGGGALDPSMGVLSLGTALSLGTMVADPLPYRAPPLWTTAAPLSGWWTVEGGVPGGLWTLDWLTQTHPPAPDAHPRQPPTRDGLTVVPYWLGHVSSPTARGMIAGLRAGHDRRDLQVAAMEGLAFEGRRAREAIEGATGLRMRQVTLVGGGTANAELCAIVAAAIGRPVRIAGDTFGGARGAAAVASLALHPDSLRRARRFCAPASALRENPGWRRDYAVMYERHYRPRAEELLHSR